MVAVIAVLIGRDDFFVVDLFFKKDSEFVVNHFLISDEDGEDQYFPGVKPQNQHVFQGCSPLKPQVFP